jgi:hypothetical protein
VFKTGYIKTPKEAFLVNMAIRERARNAHEVFVLNLLLHDPRMKAVWKQLMAEKHGMPCVYQHPAVGGAVSADGPACAQQRACAKLISFAFNAICDRVPVSKWNEEEESRKKVLAGPAESRRVADKLAANALVDPAAAEAAAATLRLAQVEEERGRWILAQMRTRDDPLVVSKDRGDRTVRGVSTLIAITLNELFGDYLYGIAAILAEVGLGEKVGRRMVRTACRPHKSIAKKANT